MLPVEVFRTTVRTRRAAAQLLRQLRGRWPHWRITFDLTDADRVLRVQTPGEAPDAGAIAALVRRSGYLCEPLPDDEAPLPWSPSNNSAT